MVVDSSVLIAFILGEDEREVFENIILQQAIAVISVVSVVEITIALITRRREVDADRLDEILSSFAIEVRGVDLQQGILARRAFAQFGRGRHPASLNFGDCFTYALAKMRDEPLLFKGEDFIKTDIVPAWRP